MHEVTTDLGSTIKINGLDITIENPNTKGIEICKDLQKFLTKENAVFHAIALRRDSFADVRLCEELKNYPS